MNAAAILIGELDDDALEALAERLRPFLDRSSRLLTAREASERLGIHPKTLTRAAADGRVRGAERVGRRWRFNIDALALESPATSVATLATVPRPIRPQRRPSIAADAIRGRRSG
jgi:excisionase family DNA binding protein